MKKFLIGLGAVVVIILIAAVVVPLLVPLDTYKQEIAQRVEKATGRRLAIDGDIRLSVLPDLGIEVHKVRFQNAPGAKAPEMMELETLRVSLSLIPLLTGEFEIDQFVLIDPVINLEIDRQGRGNWQFAAKPAAQPSPESQTQQPPAAREDPSPATPPGARKPSPGASPASLNAIRLGDVRLVNGRVSYSDAKTGRTERVEAINMKLSLPDFDRAFTADGSFSWNAEGVDLKLTVASARALAEGRTTRVEANVDTAALKFSYGGSVKNTGTLVASGRVNLDVPSIRKLAAWAGQPIAGNSKGFGPLAIKGSVGVAGPKYSFTRATMRLDNMNGNGDFRVDLSGARPSLWARMEFDKIDLNNYIAARPSQAAGGAGSASGEPQARPDGSVSVGVPGSDGGTGGAGSPATAETGWSDEPIDLTGLRAADARMALKVGGILANNIKVGRTDLNVSLRGGRLVADLTEMLLYGGKGSARIVVNAAGRVPTVENTARLTGFQAAPFMKDAMNFDRVEGTANANVSLATTGRTQRQFISALRGRGNLRFADGAIRGVNLGAMVRNIKTAFGDAARRNMQKTDFSEMTGSFTISRGILRNSDLLMKSPHLRLAGQGTVDLPQRTVNYVVTPKLVKSAEGQGGQAASSGVSVPVKVQGSWDNLSYKPDLEGAVKQLVKDPKVEESLKKIKKDDVKRTLRKLFR